MEFLEKLTQTYSPSGDEALVRDVIANEVKPYADHIETDNMGNLIVRKKGTGKKLLLAAHMDEIGLMVNYIEENGFLRFASVGYIKPYCALYQRVVFKNGVTGIVAYEEKEDLKKDFDISKMYIDIGASDAKEAMEKVSLGDCAVFEGPLKTCGNLVTAKALDNRIGVYVLVSVLKKLKDHTDDIYFVFSSQEELGLRGAKAAANSIAPHVSLCVDVTATGDTPNCNRMSVKVGEGPCIKFMDNTIITHSDVNQALKDAASEKGIAVQYEVLTGGGTDAGAIHTSGAGVKTGAVSIPCRYIHTPSETVSLKDVEGATELVLGFIE